jgi:hypothetical protein
MAPGWVTLGSAAFIDAHESGRVPRSVAELEKSHTSSGLSEAGTRLTDGHTRWSFNGRGEAQN